MVSVVARGTRKLERQFHETLGNLKSDLPSRIPEFMDLREGIVVSNHSGLQFSNWMSKPKTLNQQNTKSELFYCQKKPSFVLCTVRFQSLLMSAILF